MLRAAAGADPSVVSMRNTPNTLAATYNGYLKSTELARNLTLIAPVPVGRPDVNWECHENIFISTLLRRGLRRYTAAVKLIEPP